MVTKIFVVVILLLIGLATIFSTCKKGVLGCVNPSYYFKVTAKAYPDNDSVQIGDTIWISINFSSKLINISSLDTIDFSGATNLGTDISFDIFTGGSIDNPGTSYAANNFNYILLQGDSINNQLPQRIRAFLFKENNNMYNFKLGVIPKFTGTYGLAIGNAPSVSRKSDKCTKADFEIDFASTNQHLYLYQNNRPGYIISDYEALHLYCFKVY
jgi:hypothetical protein